MKKITLIILGPQGSGKGTQAEFLSKKLNLPLLSMGAIAKKARDGNNELAKIVKKYYDKGLLYPTSLIEKMFLKELKKINNKNIILEGIPRNNEQEKIIRKAVKMNLIYDPWVIYLKITQKTAIKRLATRYICEKCYTSYLPLESKKLNYICIKCGGKLIKRPDDKPKAVLMRLKVYEEQTKPVLEIYKKKRKLIKINGEPSIIAVNQEINNKLIKMGVI